METPGNKAAPVGETSMVVLIVVVVVLVFVFLSGAAGFWFYQRTHARGQVELTTVPADATVLVDGRTVSGRSPFKIREPRGRHTLTVKRAGYLRNEQVILVDADRPLREKVVLLPERIKNLEP